MLARKSIFVVAATLLFAMQCLCDSESVCTTKSCEKEAEQMLKKIDDSVDACENFFDFACGKYKPEIPSHKTKVDELDLILDTLQERLNITMSDEIVEDEIEPFKHVKVFFQNCMKTETMEKLKLEPIQEILDLMGGWPCTKEDWDEESWSWQQMVKDLETIGFPSNYLFEIWIEPDQKNNSRKIWKLDQPSLGVSREYLIKKLNDSIVQAYHQYQIDTAILYGAKNTTANSEMTKVLEFEFALAELSLARENRRNRSKLYNPTSINDFQKMFPSLNWIDFLNTFLTEKDRVTPDEVIILADKSIFEKLYNLLESTQKRTIANYLMWRASQTMAEFLHDQIRTRALEFAKIQSGKQTYGPRWKECVGNTAKYLPIATSALYVRKYFSENSKEVATEMVVAIKKEFELILKTVPWMDDTTRAAALCKVDSIANHIGYPNELLDDKKLIEYHKDLVINEDEYFKSVLKLNHFWSDVEAKKFRLKVNKTAWDNHANVAIANAYYNWFENSILIPAGILQGKFFNADRPRYMNFASIGYVIGHEITHGFDDQGRQYDSEGNLVDWWQEETKTAYLDKARCIIEQYGNYTEPTTGLKLNGINTQGENIADNGGVLTAYRAYKKWSMDNGEEKKLPGLNYTPNQLFWISVGQSWCSAYRIEELKLRITTGVHSVARFRIIGPLSNFPEFSKDFQCPEGSKMNPAKRCKVW